jgi:putative Holliday junction resolvase
VKVLALDYGSARTGVAVSDESGTLATPLQTIERVGTAAGMAALLAIVEAERPGLIVVGLPRTPSGERGSQAGASVAFAGRLRARVEVPVELEDERFTTTIAQQRTSRSARSSLDARAAAVLLQGVLDRRAGRC